MHVVIDLGETYTCLAGWEKGKSLAEAGIKVKIPGLAVFNSRLGSYPWEYENLHQYLAYLLREYLVPGRTVIESAALAIPDIFDLNQRRMLLDIAEEILGLYQAIIIPRSIALLAGIQINNPHQHLNGDILIIEEQDSSYRFAFLSNIESIGITLEKQFAGGLAALQTEAGRNGYYSAQGWLWDHVVLTGNKGPSPDINNFLADLPAGTDVISGYDQYFTAAEGLSACYEGSSAPVTHFNLIYPYQFYLENNKSASLEKIPFDTANLELDCSGRYKIMTMVPEANEPRVCLRIYEIKSADGFHVSKLPPGVVPILDIDCNPGDLPPHMDLILDMAAATLQFDLTAAPYEEITHTPETLSTKLLISQKQLYQLLDEEKANEALSKDWNKYLLSRHDSCSGLDDQINHTLFHLYGLLQLWNGK